MPPYVGMAGKQNGGYHGSISFQTPIFHLVVNSTRLKTLRSAVWRCPKLYIIAKSVQRLCLSDKPRSVENPVLCLILSSLCSLPAYNYAEHLGSSKMPLVCAPCLPVLLLYSSFLIVCFVGLYAGHPYIQLISFKIFLLSCLCTFYNNNNNYYYHY